MSNIGLDWLHIVLLLIVTAEWLVMTRLGRLVMALRHGVDARQDQIHQAFGLIDRQSTLINELIEKRRAAS